MEQLFLIAPIAVPVLFWAVYHYYKDRHLPEPVGHLAFTFLLGIAAAWISTALYSGLDWVGLRFDAGYLADTSSWALLAYSLLAIGPIEELAKLLPFLIVVLRFKEFDEPMDGIIYASFIGLGYAAIENWHSVRVNLGPLDWQGAPCGPLNRAGNTRQPGRRSRLARAL